ncbi:MAG: TrmH family RNA methyltransferase [Acidimicrobiia bacterium]
MSQLRSVDLKRLHRSWQRRTDQRVALLLDGVQDPFNVGGIVRTAASMRVEHLYLCGHATVPTHPKVGKTSKGTERYLQWSEHEHTLDGIAAARADGLRVVALELTGTAAPLFELDLSSDVCLVIGNESHGASEEALGACDAIGYVPLLGRVGSLNVAAATAVALYEVRRQAWQANGAP